MRPCGIPDVCGGYVPAAADVLLKRQRDEQIKRKKVAGRKKKIKEMARVGEKRKRERKGEKEHG